MRTIYLGCLALVVGVSTAHAQTATDYYRRNTDARAADLVQKVEQYHIGPGAQKMQARLYAAAWGDFDFILRYVPNHPRGLVLMADLCAVWQSRKCNLDQYFARALEINPNVAGTHLAKGVHLQRRNKLEEAIASYKVALDLEPDLANAHYNLGLLYLTQKRYDLANEHAQKAYRGGMTLPGLRDKLKSAGAWREIPPELEAPHREPPAEKAGGTAPAPPTQ